MKIETVDAFFLLQSFRKTSMGDPKTITAKNPKKNALMGQRTALGFYDIMAVNLQYCQGSCPNTCMNDGYQMYKNGECKCVCAEGLTGSRCEQVTSDAGKSYTKELQPSHRKTEATLTRTKYFSH